MESIGPRELVLVAALSMLRRNPLLPKLNAEADLDRIDNGDPTCSIAPPDAPVRPVAAARLA